MWPMAALGWTLNLFLRGRAAYAAFEEDIKGSLEPGKLADLVVLDRDYFDEAAVTDEDIKKVRSVLTMVGGRFVHGSRDSL